MRLAPLAWTEGSLVRPDSAEREVVSLPVVFAVAAAVPVRYRALVLLATFGSLRWGELAGLRRENVDLEARIVRVIETTAELDRGGLIAETPKSAAGRRTVSIPAELVPEMRWHLDRFAAAGSGDWSSLAPRAPRCAARTSGLSGTLPRRRPGSQDSTFMIFDISAGRWPRTRVQVLRSLWLGSAIRVRALR